MENLHTPRRSSRRAAFVATARLTELLTPARRDGGRDVNATARSHGDEAAADETVPNGEFRDEDSLSSAESSEADEVECPICLEETVPADIATINGCDHVFCLDCLTQWSETNNICPLCRTRFNTIESSGVLQRVPDRRPAVSFNLVGVFNPEEVGGEGNNVTVMLRQMLQIQEVQRQRNEEQLQQMRQETVERRQQMEVRQQQVQEAMEAGQLMQALRRNAELNDILIQESNARIRELRLRQEQLHGGEAERAPEGVAQQNINADVGVQADLNADFARVMDTLRSLL